MGCGVEREQENENLVRHALSVAIQRMESESGEWRCVYERVMRLVDVFVQERVVKAPVQKVDETVAEGDE